MLNEKQELALLFKDLATLRTDAPLFDDVDELLWKGPTKDFAAVAEKIEEPRLSVRANDLAKKMKTAP